MERMADGDSYRSPSPKWPPELDEGSDLLTAIEGNDLAQINRYLAAFRPGDILGRMKPYYDDPFYLAASEAKPETLRLLLDLYVSAAAEQGGPSGSFEDKRGFTLLNVACRAANIETVRFLLDTRGSWSLETRRDLGLEDEDLQKGHRGSDWTPILEAASSINELCFDDAGLHKRDVEWSHWVSDRIARGEQVIRLLLDRGCSATDVIPPFHLDEGGQGQPRDSVLGLAMGRASKNLVQYLIDHGADVFLKHQHWHNFAGVIPFRRGKEMVHDVITLHMASLFWNVDIVEFLLQYHHKGESGHDLASCRDTNGRAPLHWAAAGPDSNECRLLDEDLSTRISTTFQLLLSAAPETVNMVDDAGFTPLHYAVQTHATCAASSHAEIAIRCLLEHGADPAVADSNGQTVLHMLGFGSLLSGPIRTGLLDSLVAHGVDINHATSKGVTALHVMASNLRHVSVVKYLLENGADLRSTTSTGATAFHRVAEGRLFDGSAGYGDWKNATAEDYTRAEDDMLRLLQTSFGGSTLVNQRNLAGKTPLQLLEETRKKRWERGEQMRAGMGMGRGRGRGQAIRE
ncbi:ankyrin repeat-containing domain protein [Aspergillus keveii]|uniref:Ankyrin repeat-containing domain protein n=1 Tax=Aspergillus keveii TaxID=714993 RepID=A0ABR4FHE3_9EURO